MSGPTGGRREWPTDDEDEFPQGLYLSGLEIAVVIVAGLAVIGVLAWLAS